MRGAAGAVILRRIQRYHLGVRTDGFRSDETERASLSAGLRGTDSASDAVLVADPLCVPSCVFEGKTHTMGTSSSAGQSKEDHGIIPRVLYQLFELMKANEKTHTYMLNIQFIEIYNGKAQQHRKRGRLMFRARFAS